MMRISIASLAVISSVGFTSAFLYDNKCGKAAFEFDGIFGRVQCNYNEMASKRYSYSYGVHKLWAYTDDLPHSKNAGGKNPRTEITLKDKHSYTN